MADNKMLIQQEINQNMSVISNASDVQNEEDMLNSQFMLHSRASRKKASIPKQEQQRNTLEWVKKSSCENILDIGRNQDTANQWSGKDIGQNDIQTVRSNNRASSEDLNTIRENIRNNQQSQNRRSSENILTIDENIKNAKNAAGHNVSNVTITIQDRNPTSNDEDKVVKRTVSQEYLYRTAHESGESLNASTDCLKQSFRGSCVKDAHTYAIDLSNNCREFYFSHQKKAEAIKQSIRSTKHTRAMEKMGGKETNSIDNAMERLRSEMAELMDQDLSLMSQLLKLNDKIEEVKTHVSSRMRRDSYDSSSCYLNGSETELSDYEDSRIDLSASARDMRIPGMSKTSNIETESESNINIQPRKIAPAERDIIVYRKKSRRPKGEKKNKRRKSLVTDSETEKEDADAETESDESTEHGESSGTESTISYKSCSTTNASDTNDTDAKSTKSETMDSGVKKASKPGPPVPPKPVKGGVSRNSNFLKFHKSYGIKSITGSSSVMTLQGHNIPIEKYYVPQDLVYLKHTESDNVFCQFSH